jgi:hypothetical protein
MLARNAYLNGEVRESIVDKVRERWDQGASESLQANRPQSAIPSRTRVTLAVSSATADASEPALAARERQAVTVRRGSLSVPMSSDIRY